MLRLIQDALSRPLEVPALPRIVSLVPSVTELVFELGAGERLVGCTRYCTEPAGRLDGVARVGGQKDPDLAAIVALAPDLVLAVEEENLERDVLRLAELGVQTYVAAVHTVEDAVALLGEIGEVIDAEPALTARLRARVVDGVSRARRPRGPRSPSVFCPVWRDPWISLSADTYAWNALELVGARPIAVATHETRDRRYPKVRLDDVVAARPDIVLLLDEPFPFAERDAEEIRQLFPNARVLRFAGKSLLWYGRRTGDLASLAALLAGE